MYEVIKIIVILPYEVQSWRHSEADPVLLHVKTQ